MSCNCKTPADVQKFLKENDIPYVDLRFTDPRGKWQHLTMCSDFVDDDAFADGVMFDGSSIAGWKAINESDMTLMPDCASAVMDPFAAQEQLILFCDVIEPSTGQPREFIHRFVSSGQQRRVLLEDWQDVYGVRMPKRRIYVDSAGRPTTTIEMISVSRRRTSDRDFRVL